MTRQRQPIRLTARPLTGCTASSPERLDIASKPCHGTDSRDLWSPCRASTHVQRVAVRRRVDASLSIDRRHRGQQCTGSATVNPGLHATDAIIRRMVRIPVASSCVAAGRDFVSVRYPSRLRFHRGTAIMANPRRWFKVAVDAIFFRFRCCGLCCFLRHHLRLRCSLSFVS